MPLELDDGEDLPGFVDLMHVLSRSADALDKSARAVVGADGALSDDEIRWRLLEINKGRQSLFKDLDWKTRNKEIPYDDLARLLKIMLREVERFRFLLLNVQGFLSRSRPIEPKKRQAKLSELIDEVVDLFEFAAKEKGVHIERMIQGDPMLWIDRDLVQRALVNLVDNAVKYSFSGSERSKQRFISILVRRHSPDGKWLIAITSYGVGILPEEIRTGTIFMYGVRGQLARDRDRSGTGIGLAEAKRIIEAHQGKILVESDPKGEEVYLTTVNIILPSG